MESALARVYGPQPPKHHRADNVLTALILVSCGLAVTFAPPSIHMPNVVYRRCSGAPQIPFDLLCMYRKDERSPLLQAMLETVRSLRSAPDDDQRQQTVRAWQKRASLRAG